jgi:hypothetical protein
MREDYKITGTTKKLEIEVEERVAEVLKKMETYTKIPASELANTALKRFISSHKDFLPPAGLS